MKGIGEKTAVKLITQFGTIEELLRRIDEVTPTRIKALLVEQGENARLSKRLATIQLDCPVQFEPEQFRSESSPHGRACRSAARTRIHDIGQGLSAGCGTGHVDRR